MAAVRDREWIWKQDNSYSWSDDALENILLHFTRTENREMSFENFFSGKLLDRDYMDVMLKAYVEQGIEQGLIILQESQEGLIFYLSEKGVDEGTKLSLIYNL